MRGTGSSRENRDALKPEPERRTSSPRGIFQTKMLDCNSASESIPISTNQDSNISIFPGGSGGKESACSAWDLGSIPGLGRSPGGGHGNPLKYSCLETPHGQRSLVGYSPWGCKELDIIQQLSLSSLHRVKNQRGHRRCNPHTQRQPRRKEGRISIAIVMNRDRGERDKSPYRMRPFKI